MPAVGRPTHCTMIFSTFKKSSLNLKDMAKKRNEQNTFHFGLTTVGGLAIFTNN